MDARRESDPVKNRTTMERKSEREVVVTRTVNAPARLVFEAWTKAELFRRWWVPKSYGLTLLSCELDVRVGGQYRLVFRHEEGRARADLQARPAPTGTIDGMDRELPRALGLTLR